MSEEQKTDEQNCIQIGGPGSSHDAFAIWTVSDVTIAGDIIEHYIEEDVSQFIDPTHLKPFDTVLVTKDQKKVILDRAFTAQFRDDATNSEVFIAVEHKSSPNIFTILQLVVQALLSLYSMWTKAGYTDAKTFKLPVPIMILLYTGNEDWDTSDMNFQGLFEYIPEPLRKYVPQFYVIGINLKNYDCDNLPGGVDTRAAFETMIRTKNGTMPPHLNRIVESLNQLPPEPRTDDLKRGIIVYTARSGGATKEQIEKAISVAWKGKEGIKMAETAQKSYYQEVLEAATAEVTANVTAKMKAESTLKILRVRFRNVPDEITRAINAMNDPIALTSLEDFAMDCESLDDFAKNL